MSGPDPDRTARDRTARDRTARDRAARDRATRVAALFEDVVDLPPEEASRRLDEARAGDAALVADVERLLAHDRAAAPGFLAPPVAQLAETAREPAPTAADPVAGASRLGHFFILRELGQGGMGTVYLGYDEELDRPVAIKLLHRGGASAWLRHEGRALGRLAHPNVVAVHAIGEHEGRIFLAMELVHGPSLRVWLGEEARPFAAILDTLLQAGRGLAAVHDAGLVHRDFKPDNVLVGADGRVRVADLGIAAAADEVGGGLAGTPGFMAPEQLRGERATPASDQFSFCVTLYRAAYGVAPFSASPAPPPPRSDVPAWLHPILRRGLAVDPAARFPSMAALLAAVERHLPRDPDVDPAPVRREQILVIAVLLLLAIGVGAAVLGPGGPGTPTALAGSFALIRLALVVVVVSGAAVAFLWRRLSRNLYGRRLAAIFPGIGVALLVHRLVALRLGTPMLHVLVVDHVILGVVFGATAITLDRVLGWFALLALAGAAVSAASPSLAPLSFGLLTILVPALALLELARRR